MQYQNCAPSNEALDSSSDAQVDVRDAQVDGIDRVDVGDISFAQSKVDAFSDDPSVVVRGVCGQSGSIISWTLSDAHGGFIERGMSECDLGSFEVALSDQWKGHCDQDLILQAALGAKASSEATVSAYCE